MQSPMILEPRTLGDETTVFESFVPLPGLGVLPVQAYLLSGEEPVLVDTGLAAFREPFLQHLASQVEPDALRWIWLTHADGDHAGNLAAVLDWAPRARVVTSFLGAAKLALWGISTDRAYFLNPGQTLDLADRQLSAHRPPTYDAPETTACFDSRSRTLYSSDAFGALLEEPSPDAAGIPERQLVAGMRTWASVDAPWLAEVDPGRFREHLEDIARLAPRRILGTHLPPATGMTARLLAILQHLPGIAPFVGPDQAAVEALMAPASIG